MLQKNVPFYTFKVCLLGEGGVGDTCLSQTIYCNKFNMDTRMTIGVDFYTYDIPILLGSDLSNDIVRMSIWDIDANENFKKLIPYYLNGANGIFFYFNLAEANIIKKLKSWNEILINSIDKKIPRALIGCRCDLLKKRVSRRRISKIRRFMKKQKGFNFFHYSPLSKKDIKMIFIDLTKRMLALQKLTYEDLG